MQLQFLWGAAALALISSPVSALDVATFESIVDKTLAAIEEDNVNVEKILRYQDELITIGVIGAKGFGAQHQDFTEAMDFVAASTERMKALNLVSIETEWHEGGAFEGAGIDTEALYDDDFASIYMEAVIHPATAHIAARAYRITGDEDYLDQVVFELEEIVDHFEDLKD